VNTLLIFGTATLTGVVASLVTSFFTNRTAVEDRATRVSIANEDRAFEVRKEACVDLEMQRLGQWDYVQKVQRHAVSFFSAETLPTLPPPTDPRLVALKSITLSDKIVRSVNELNNAYGEYLELIRKWEFGDSGLPGIQFRVEATTSFVNFESKTNDLWDLLRAEASIARRNS
jgi:hypothetical protein